MPVNAVLNASPDLIPARDARYAAMLYPPGRAPSNVVLLPARTYVPTDVIPAGERRVGVVQYAPGAAVPANLRRVILVPVESNGLTVKTDTPAAYWRLAEAAPTAYVADAFTRADSASSLGAADTGQAWTVQSAAAVFGISSNKGYLVSATNGTYVYAYVDVPAVTDVAVVADITLSATANRADTGLVLGGIDDANYLLCEVVKTGTGALDYVAIWKRDAGTFTQLAVLDTQGLVNGTGYRVKFQRAGAVLTAWINGVLKLTYTLTAGNLTKFGTTTKHGIWLAPNSTTLDDKGSRFDNVAVSALPAPAADASGNANTGTYLGATRLGAAGLVAGSAALAVDAGLTGYVSTAYKPFVIGTTRTFECWFTVPDTASHALIGADSVTNAPLLRVSAGGVDWYATLGAGAASWAGVVVANTVYHLVLVYNDATLVAELYLNGVSQGTASTGAAYSASTFNLQIGASLTASHPFRGTVDEVAVYAGALSAARVAAHYAGAAW